MWASCPRLTLRCGALPLSMWIGPFRIASSLSRVSGAPWCSLCSVQSSFCSPCASKSVWAFGLGLSFRRDSQLAWGKHIAGTKNGRCCQKLAHSQTRKAVDNRTRTASSRRHQPQGVRATGWPRNHCATKPPNHKQMKPMHLRPPSDPPAGHRASRPVATRPGKYNN